MSTSTLVSPHVNNDLGIIFNLKDVTLSKLLTEFNGRYRVVCAGLRVGLGLDIIGV